MVPGQRFAEAEHPHPTLEDVMPALPRPAKSTPARRTLLHSAWAAPLIITATAAPAFAGSGPLVLTLKYDFSYKPDRTQDKATFTFTITQGGLPITDGAELVFTAQNGPQTTSIPVTVTNGSGTYVMTFGEYIGYNSQYNFVQLSYMGAFSPSVVLTAFF